MKYRRQKDIVARKVAGENLLVPINGCAKKVYTLNNVGERLWEAIEEPKSQEELASSLVEHYKIAKETASKDVQAFLDDMLRMELVVPEG
ncbi:PqqD family protein [Pontiella sp.]|uniref:PqqD family protein n=1 Tax=Pontiella sp. TaxID=2837462 RepID=UPI003561D2A3